MKILGTLCTLALFLFLIAPTPGYAQDRDENKPQEEQKPKDNDKANAKQEDKVARPDDSRRSDNPNIGRQDEREKQPEASRPQEQQQRDERREQRPGDNDRRSDRNMGRDQHQHQAADRGRHIPDEQFRSHFGRQHTFHVQRTQIVNVSQPVVVFAGYSFQLIDPWPAEWAFDDDCYIDYIDGEYFLFDVLHPGIRIAVFVVG